MKHRTVDLILFILFMIAIIMVMLMAVGLAMESAITELHGKTIITFEECRLANGQVMIDETCERRTKCLDHSFLFYTCEEIRNGENKQ